MPDTAPRPPTGSSAKAQLLTVLGEFVLPAGGEVWTSSVVAALGLLGVEEGNARQAVARVADDGLLTARRRGRRTRWALTGAGRDLLVAGTERIYRFGGESGRWDGRWLVILCSVPEDQRAKRHQLRSRLGFAGFGFLGPGVAISPHLGREPAALLVLDDLGMARTAVVLRAELGGDIAGGDVLRRAWDMDGLGGSYEDFLTAAAARRPVTTDECFAATVALVHDWRRFPSVDPEIPPQLLPAAWPGTRARELFHRLHGAWSPEAARWFDAAEEAAG